MQIQNYVFVAVLLASLAVFAKSALRLISYLRIAKPENRTNNIPKRLSTTLLVGFGQSKILRDPIAGPLHASIFWGFLVLLFSAMEMVLEGLHDGWSFSFLGPLYTAITILTDLFCLAIIVSAAIALWRRYVTKIVRLQFKGEQLEAGLILLTIFLIVSALFVQNGLREYVHGPDFDWAFRPLSHPVGTFLYGVLGDTAQPLFHIAWWTHAVLILSFLNYLPYSKHLHVLTAIPNVFFGPITPTNKLEPIDFEAEGVERFGIVDVEDFTWKALLDGYTCTHCGRCTSVCPANQTGKVLDPRGVIVAMHQRTMDKAPLILKKQAGVELQEHEQALWDKKLVGDYISQDALWACTTCGACMQECPVNIEHVPAIVGMRRSMVMMESQFNEESALLPDVYGNMETNAVPWGGFSQADRANWTEGMGIQTAAEDPTMDVLFWVGCAGSYDERAKKVTKSFAELMQIAGVNFRILGQEESCNGDVARRTGNEFLADTLTKTNIETLNRYNVTKIVTTCPHCFNTLRNEYSQYGYNAEVLHHTVFIGQLIESGRLTIDKSKLDAATITYHDSCYMGRYNGEYDAPRDVLESVPGVKITEPATTQDRAMCCGAGGGRMYMEETVGTRVNEVRTRQLLDTGATTIAVNCPFCATMITDGVKAADKVDSVQILDVSEIVRKHVTDNR